MSNWFIVYNGQQVGPMEKEQMLSYGLNPNSRVWREGMPEWVFAYNVPELMEMISQNREYAPQPPYPQGGGYGMGGYSEPQQNNNICAIIGMILGILSLCTIFSIWFSLSFAIAGLVLSIIGRKNPYQRGMATAGLVCSIITLALFALGIIFLVTFGVALFSAFL